MNHRQSSEPEYADDDFERFRRERLAQKKTQKMTRQRPDTEVLRKPALEAVPKPVAEPPPEEGYLDDDFARFRTARMQKGKVAPPEPEPAPEEHELFFGTTSNQRRQIRAAEADAREAVELSQADTVRVKRRQTRRRQSETARTRRRKETSATPRRLTPSGRQPQAG